MFIKVPFGSLKFFRELGVFKIPYNALRFTFKVLCYTLGVLRVSVGSLGHLKVL